MIFIRFKAIPVSWHSRPLSPSPGALLGTGRGLKVSQSLLFSRLDNPSSPSLAPEGFQPSDQLRGLLCSRISTSLWRPRSCRWGLPRAEEKGNSPGGPVAVGWLCCPCAVPQLGVKALSVSVPVVPPAHPSRGQILMHGTSHRAQGQPGRENSWENSWNNYCMT